MVNSPAVRFLKMDNLQSPDDRQKIRNLEIVAKEQEEIRNDYEYYNKQKNEVLKVTKFIDEHILKEEKEINTSSLIRDFEKLEENEMKNQINH